MSNEVATIPYNQLERMATVVAKSGLYAAKTPEAALTIMMLAQSENVHPMTAMRDWHIMDIRGRTVVSMKAEAMLARFQEAGGKVKWIKLADDGASATFSHPHGGEVMIEWDIPRATRAGLIEKDLWKSYRRAMFRSRVVSEGVRTVLPSVLGGRRTPEESMNVDSEIEPINIEAAVQSFERPGLSAEDAARHMDIISKAIGLETLKEGFGTAYKAAKAVGDEARMESFKLVYESRKGEIVEAEKAIAGAIEAKKEEQI